MGNPGKEVGYLLLFAVIYFECSTALHIELTAVSRPDARILLQEVHGRQKRHWIVPPINVRENEDYASTKPIIAKIRSDAESSASHIKYSISGQGADQEPFGYFYVNADNGSLYILQKVDREKNPTFHLKGYAKDQHGTDVEPPLDLQIRVNDVNDNGPVFVKKHFYGSVKELSDINTLITTLNATDADEPNTANAQLAYFIAQSSVTKMFTIKKDSGKVFPGIPNLDREKQATYNLSVEVRDLNGEAHSNRDAALLTITLLDVNDNVPVLEKSSYEGSVEENKANIEVIRIKAYDADEEFTDNWLVNFTIVSGNENGYFKIETDTKTNEGVLIIVKEADYEQLKQVLLHIVFSNKAAYHHSLGIVSSNTPIPIKVNITNVVEGAIFQPSRKIISISEDRTVVTLNKVITRYEAVEEDTGSIAKNIIYAKDYDADNWISIDTTTSEIKLIKYPDRESSHVVNGTYIVKIIAISQDVPPRTATGTIVLEVEDINDNCPQVDTTPQTICEDVPYINITATDRDDDPYAGPFSFKIVDEPQGTAEIWKVGETYGTSMQLVRQKPLWPKEYEVQLQVKDKPGLMCTEKQIVKLYLCSCPVDGINCAEGRGGITTVLGGGAIGLMILAFLLLLLVPLLLLLCKCGAVAGPAFALIPDVTTETLQPWNKEGAAPQDKVPISFSASTFSEKSIHASGEGMDTSGIATSAHVHGLRMATDAQMTRTVSRMHAGGTSYAAEGAGFSGGYQAGSREMLLDTSKSMSYAARHAAPGGAVSESFLLKYYMEQSGLLSEEDARIAANDCVMVYQSEGIGSPAGSVGCCSFIESDLEEDFLDDLGPKFKKLAEICTGTEIRREMTYTRFGSTGESSTVGHQQAIRPGGSSIQSSSQSTAKATSHSESSFHRSSPPIQPVISPSQSTVHSSSKYTAQIVSHSQSAEPSSRIAVQNIRLPSPEMHVSHLKSESLVHPNVMVLDGLHTPFSSLQVTGTVPDGAIQQHVLVAEHSLAPGTILQPVGVVAEPVVLQQHYLLAETSRAAGPASHSILQPISNLGGTHNVILVEGNVASAPSPNGYLVNVEPQGHQQVLVGEVASAPSATVKSSLSKVTKYSTVKFSES